MNKSPSDVPSSAAHDEALYTRLVSGEVRVGVIGLGNLGISLVGAIIEAGLPAIGFDTESAKIDVLTGEALSVDRGQAAAIRSWIAQGRFRAVTDFSLLSDIDVVLLCVPTSLTRNSTPEISELIRTVKVVSAHLRQGQLLIVESTTFPGAAREIFKPLLERDGLRSGTDFFLAHSPAREDPGDPERTVSRIPKIVAGEGAAALRLVRTFYERLAIETVPVSSLEVAEAAKLTENVFRAINVTLANELKLIYQAMGLDVWEIIEAASSKPFGFMPFYPGPGLGGPSLAVAPFYLSWKAQQYDAPTEFIKLAGDINAMMPQYVVERVAWAMDQRFSKPLRGARVLLLGIAYKKNVADIRESPALKIMELLESRGARVFYHDPHVPEILPSTGVGRHADRTSISLEPSILKDFDATIICTDHDIVDYSAIVKHAALIIDTRHIFARQQITGENIVDA